jgi:hypothetical protein
VAKGSLDGIAAAVQQHQWRPRGVRGAMNLVIHLQAMNRRVVDLLFHKPLLSKLETSSL